MSLPGGNEGHVQYNTISGCSEIVHFVNSDEEAIYQKILRKPIQPAVDVLDVPIFFHVMGKPKKIFYMIQGGGVPSTPLLNPPAQLEQTQSNDVSTRIHREKTFYFISAKSV